MFTLQLVVSFLIGGLAVALQTLIGERVPLRWRGPVLTIPSTLGLALFFVGFTKGEAAGQEAAMIVPAALGAEYLFVMSFALFIRYGLLVALPVSSFVILAGGTFILLFPPATLLSSVFLYGLPAIILASFITGLLPRSPNLRPVPMNARYIAMRSLLGGTILVTVILLSKLLGNTWGGLFAAFPAVFLSTFLIYYFAHGRAVIPSVASSMFFPGSLGLILYAAVTLWSFPIYGIWIGTLLSYLGVACFFTMYTKLNLLLTNVPFKASLCCVLLLVLVFVTKKDEVPPTDKVSCTTDDECRVLTWTRCGCTFQKIVHRDSSDAAIPASSEGIDGCTAVCGMPASWIESATCSPKGTCVPSVCKRHDGEIIDC